MLYVPVCRTTTTAVHSTVVFCSFRTSRPAVRGTRHDTTRVSTSTPSENVDHEELQLVLDGCWRRLANTWVVRVVVLWWCCGIPRCFEVQKGFLGVCMQEISRKGCSPLLFLNRWPRIWLFRAPVRNSLLSIMQSAGTFEEVHLLRGQIYASCAFGISNDLRSRTCIIPFEFCWGLGNFAIFEVDRLYPYSRP